MDGGRGQERRAAGTGRSDAADGAERRIVVGGRYRLLRVIGTGGMGRVWLADDELLRREVAVKEIGAPADVSSGDLLTRQLATMREARAAARLDHDGVVRVFDVVWSPGRSWIVMEHVRSRSLQDIVREGGPLAHREAARVGLAVLRALRAAHAAGVLHRDVKPHNVLIAEDGGRVVLSDFGLATFEGADAGDTGPLMGSPHFVAPERLRAGGAADDTKSSPEADLWSLGATLYSIVEGRAPFARDTTTDSLSALLTEPPDAMRSRGPLEPVIMGLLVKDPAGRMTAGAAEDALRRVASRAVGTVPMPGRPAPAVPPQRRPGTAHGLTRIPPVTRPAPVPAGRATGSAAVPPPAAAAPVTSRRRERGTRIAVIAAVVALAGAAGAAFVDGTPPDDPGRVARTAVASAAASPAYDVTCEVGGSGGAPVTAAPGGQPYALPDGWIWHRDERGFRLAVPAGWTRFTDGGAVCFADPDGTRTLAVDAGAPLTRRPLDYWQQRERQVTLPGYQRVAMGVVLLRNGGADWEYTWAPVDRPRQHVRRLLLAVGAQRAYLLQWTTRDQDWPLNEPHQRLIVASFS